MQNAICLEWVYSEEVLAHHGILGQKWGKRHGPPYPLSSKVSKAIKKGRISSGKPGGASEPSKDASDPHGKKITKADKVKAHVKPIAAALGSTAGAIAFGVIGGAGPLAPLLAIPVATVYGGATVVGEFQNIVAKHKEKKVADIQSKSEVDKDTGLRRKEKETTIKEDIKMINPAYKDLYKNSKHNCALCSVTYDMRRRGYDVTAQKASSGYSDNDIEKMYKNGKFDHITYDTGFGWVNKTNKKIMDKLSTQGTGARGIVTVAWTNGGGHAMSYEVTPEGPRIIDAQSGVIYKNAISTIAHSTGYMSIMRTDTLTPNYDLMKKEAVS